MENLKIFVPYDKIAPDTLNQLIDSYIDREGTDYGDHEISREIKRSQVFEQLKSKEALLSYEVESETINIVLKDT